MILRPGLKTIVDDVKQLRALDQICQAYVRLNGGAGEGFTGALQQLQAAAEELAKHSRNYQKSVADAASATSGKDRTAIIAWAMMIECELRDWAEQLTVVDYNYLRLCLDDAAHRALYWGYADASPDSLSSVDPFDWQNGE